MVVDTNGFSPYTIWTATLICTEFRYRTVYLYTVLVLRNLHVKYAEKTVGSLEAHRSQDWAVPEQGLINNFLFRDATTLCHLDVAFFKPLHSEVS